MVGMMISEQRVLPATYVPTAGASEVR